MEQVALVQTGYGIFVGRMEPGAWMDGGILSLKQPRGLRLTQVQRAGTTQMECQLEPIIGMPDRLIVRDWLAWHMVTDVNFINSYIQAVTGLTLASSLNPLTPN